MTAVFNGIVLDALPFDGPGTAPGSVVALLSYANPRKATLVEAASDIASANPRKATLVEAASDIASANPRKAVQVQ